MSNTNLLKRITAETKRLRKKHPGASYHSLQRKAAAKFKKKRHSKKSKRRIGVVASVGEFGASPGVLAVVSGVRKKRKAYYKGQRVPVKHIVGTIAHHRNAACTLLKHRLANELVSRELATTKTKKRKLSKKIAKTKKEIRSLK